MGGDGMGYEINWSCTPNDPVKDHPLYQKWSTFSLADLAGDKATIMGDMVAIRMDCDSAPIVSYLSWLIRTINLVA